MTSPRETDEQLAAEFGRREVGGMVLFEPGEFGYHCPNGHAGGHLAFSEFNDHMWCYACDMDFHYAQDCYLIRPSWMGDQQWADFLAKLPVKPEIRPGAVSGGW